MGLTTASALSFLSSYCSLVVSSTPWASSHSMPSLTAASSAERSSSLMCSRRRSFAELRTLYRYDSSALRASTFSRLARSSSANCSASLTMRWISSSLRRPLSPVMVIWWDLPEALSSAATCRMPLASTSKDTSIWGTPRGAGGMPVSSNLPSRWLSLVMERSPSNTWMSTAGWLSWYVEKVCDFFVGMTELRLIILVNTPPTVSIPWERGFTSSSSRSVVSLFMSPLRMPPCTAAPWATASSGLMPREGSLPK
mmetsp:Transcript_16092/g.54675  ORF Transcript_16092/g.54675 Transcript_16092/m.54675 type:complete len:254 (+) Transcript_16092:71-832(+)